MTYERFVLIHYDEIGRDPKFDGVRDDLRCMGLWLRLLMLADPLWPSAAPVPSGTPKNALERLVEAGLIELQGSTYRVHGLDSERAKRSERGRANVNKRWHPDDTAVVPPQYDGNTKGILAPPTPSTTPSPRERTSSSPLSDGPVWDAIKGVEKRSGRYFGHRPGSSVWETLEADVRDFGVVAVLGAMDALDLEHPDAGQLVFGATRFLHPIKTPDPETRAQRVRDAADKERQDAEQERRRRMLAGEEV